MMEKYGIDREQNARCTSCGKTLSHQEQAEKKCDECQPPKPTDKEK